VPQSAFVEVPASQVDPRVVAATERLVDAGLALLDIGAIPVIRWVLRADAVPEVDRLRVLHPRGTVHGNVHGFVALGTYDPETGWAALPGGVAGRPEVFLRADEPAPDAVLHELRHLHQVREGGWANHDAERDAIEWAERTIATMEGPWRPGGHTMENRAARRRADRSAREARRNRAN